MKVLVAVVVIVAACIGTASSEPAVQTTESAWTEMLPVVTAGVCDAGTMNLDTKGHHPLGHESNINFEVSTDQKAQLDFYWKNEVGLTVQNTPEAVVLEGFNSHTVFKGTNYSVKQIRFHSQSQVEVNSQPAAMDAEVVHKSAEGKAFVLVILFDKGAAKNAALEKMPWDRVQNAHSKATAHQAINIDYLLPKTWAYYHYLGALKGSGSDAECSQQVPYVVMHYRSVLTQAQLSQFPTSSKYKASSRKTKTPAIMYNQFFFAAMHQPQDCLVGAWGAHGACSKSCGGGTKSRTRTLSPPKHGGAACSQSTTSQASCNTQPCPINCVVSSWAAYGECSKSCGGGTKHRQRTITTAPQHGGTACASTTSSASCRTQPCPVDCALSSWGGWRSCSKVCGGGTKSRSRTVRTQPAHGGTACAAVSETRSCNTQPCPVNCLVGSWASWGSCSKTCAGGTHSTSRPVTRQAAHGGVACPSLSKSRVCNTTPCPIHCTVSSWARWSSCTKTCGSGTSQRARSITKAAAHGGNSCANTKETKQCNTHKCAVHCAVSSWGGWGSCSKACGGGTRTRRRTVTRNAAHGGNACGALSTSQGCNAQACPTRSPTRTPTRTPTRVPTRTPSRSPTRAPTRVPVQGHGKTDFMRINPTYTHAFISDGDGTFTHKTYKYPSGWNFGTNLNTWAITVGDWNGDGKTDFMRVHGTYTHAFISAGDGTFTHKTYKYPSGWNFGSNLNTWAIVVGNWDGDGKKANWQGAQYWSQGQGSTQAATGVNMYLR